MVLLHQHTPADAAERVELCERVVTSYYLLLASQGIELTAPGKRLASAWFAEQRDYLAFLKSEGVEAFRTMRGYFHPTLNAVIAYDARSGDAQRAPGGAGLAARGARPVRRDGRSDDPAHAAPLRPGRARLRGP